MIFSPNPTGVSDLIQLNPTGGRGGFLANKFFLSSNSYKRKITPIEKPYDFYIVSFNSFDFFRQLYCCTYFLKERGKKINLFFLQYNK